MKPFPNSYHHIAYRIMPFIRFCKDDRVYLVSNKNASIIVPIAESNNVEVIAVTNIATSITSGFFYLDLTSPVMLMGNEVYYLGVYNQVNACEIAAVDAGIGTGMDAPPINFRVQNLSSGFVIGDTLSSTDVSLLKTPWLAALS